MDCLAREDLPFSQSLPEFQRIFPDDTALCGVSRIGSLEWRIHLSWCEVVSEPFRFVARPGVLRRRACRKDVGLMEHNHIPLSTWFWAAYLIW